MPGVSIAIQSHPLRAEMAATLASCIGAPDVVFDPDPDSVVKSPWRTYRHALELTPPGAAGRLIVQDDVLVCDHFAEGVEMAAAAKPDRVLVFYVSAYPPPHLRAVRWACNHEESWAELDLTTWIPAVCTLWPVRLIEPFLAWVDRQQFPDHMVADDTIIGLYLRDIGEAPLASMPSLVEHPDTVPSIAAGHRRVTNGTDTHRQAAFFIGDCGFCDARQIDWTLGPSARF